MKSKQKTRKSVFKRVKITGRGKILHCSNFKGHLRRNKSKKQLRGLKKTKMFARAYEAKIRKLLGIRK